MNKVILSGYFVAPAEDIEKVRAALPKHASLTNAEDGCLKFEAKENATQQGRFDVYEEFASKDAFEAHKQRAQASDFATVTQNIERHYQISGLDD